MATMTMAAEVTGLTPKDRELIPWRGDWRYEVIDGVIVLSSRGGTITHDDLESIRRATGWRYELLGGAIYVNAAPSFQHQGIVGQLVSRLLPARTPGLLVRIAPVDVILLDDTTTQPDLIVTHRDRVVDGRVVGPPVLAVEVLSRRTRYADLGSKRALYAEAGVASYWVVDALQRPGDVTLQVWELVDGEYVEVAFVSGSERWTAARPFPVTIVPADLLED